VPGDTVCSAARLFVKQDLLMRFRLPPDYSFAPMLALIPGLLMLAAFEAGGEVNTVEAALCGMVIIAGAGWAGLKQARVFSEPVTRVDTTLASTILNALPDPVVLLDGRRRVMAANVAADELLGEGLNGRDVCMVLRHPDAKEAIDAVVEKGGAQADAEVVFEAPVRRVYQIQVMGVPKNEGLSVRAVVALHEITALKQAESMRADFVANVSHELRSPLSALTGFIETLQTTAKDDPDAQERFLAIMNGEAGRMSRLIGDLLSLSRIEVNEHIRPTDSVNVAKVIADVADQVQIKAAKKGMTLSMGLPENLQSVTGDADELRQVFQNLVDNAVNYGAPDTMVEISAKAIARCVETGTPGVQVSVRDFGDGIDKDKLPRLTERFYRLDKGRSRAMGGTGLGLAIVKHIINRHRGRLSVDSTVGEGSVFTVELPTTPSISKGSGDGQGVS